MKKVLFMFLTCCALVKASAQTGIGTTTPNPSAKLDVYADNKGFLPPRVTLTSASSASPITNPAEGLLVYNIGSVGLQAGYYYWNGANWATIATATSAGNGVTSMDMVKLYGEAHSSASGKMGNATTGFAFTVPVSGRYLFDFTSTATTLNGGTNTIYFQVRQGTTMLASDMQSSYNNNVHVEYNGKVELNLQAGTSYNIYNYSTSGSFETNDYDRVYYKLVAGNLPVTGQTVDYISVTRNSSQSLNTGDNVKFNVVNAGNIPYDASTGNFTLSANKTYRLTGNVTLSTGNASAAEADFTWRTAAGNNLGNNGMILSMNHNVTAGGNGISDIIYTPTINTTVSLYVIWSSGNAATQSNNVFATIEQIGSSAIINPWTLSGTNTFNTTGNVGIGNNTPTTALDVTGTGKFSTSIINNGNRTYFGKDGVNMHWFGTTDAVGEPNNLAYGFESNGTSIQSHKWYTAGTEKMKLINTGKLGIGTSTPATTVHIENGNIWGGSDNPSTTLSPSLYILNNNNTSTSANSSALIRTAGLAGGKPFLSLDVMSQFGYSIGVNNPTDQLILNTTWNFATGTSGNNAITINRTGKSRVLIPEQGGSVNTDWPAWGGGLATYDICAASIYASNYVSRSDIRLKNTISIISDDDISKYLALRPVNFYWNQDKPRDPKLQYGLIAQEVEKLFPEIIITATDSMQTKSINYQALHALSLKVIQAQQIEINALKKKQAEFEERLLKLEAKLN